MNYGLLANKAVQWLVGNEPDVRTAIKAFLRDEMDGNSINVAGPPPMMELAEFRAGRRKEVNLPLVTLWLKKTTHHLTGEPGVQVVCSDADLEKIVSWSNMALLSATIGRG